MAFVVERPGGRWEIRESRWTPAGPRARTLAVFKVLDAETLDRARRAATIAFDTADVLRACRERGVPVGPSAVDAHAAGVIRAIASGRSPRPGLLRVLRSMLEGTAEFDDLAPWIGVDDDERAAAVADLLSLTDALPEWTPDELSFPGFRDRR